MRSRFDTVIRLIVCGLLLESGCPRPTPSSPPPPVCESQTRGSNIVQEATARASVGANQFTLDATVASNALRRGVAESHLVLRRNTSLSLQVDVQTIPDSELQIQLLMGDGFHGPKEAFFTSSDRETLRGSIDGRAIAPFSIHAKPETVRFADGSPVPPGSIDQDVQQALQILARSVKEQCRAATPSPPPLAPPADGGGSDPPGHPFSPNNSAPCIACVAAASVAIIVCWAAVAGAADICTVAWPVCAAAGLLGCVAAINIGLQTICHSAQFAPAVGGGPCCPVGCGGGSCCDVGETCVGPRLCCSPGFKGCGSSNCCAGTDTCMADGNCCPADRNVCNGVCCPNAGDTCHPMTQACCKQGAVCGDSCCDGPDQVCVNSSSSACCAKAHACGTACCAVSETCADPNRGTCSPCSDCTGPEKECCFGQCCVGPKFFCDSGSRSCRCRPDCNNKCGGASDGCGGTCTGDCGEPMRCVGQTCCTPKCAGKLCGAIDGCGGTCAGSCPQGQVCNAEHVCKPITDGGCGQGRIDCCGDASCCLTAGQCYKCKCT